MKSTQTTGAVRFQQDEKLQGGSLKPCILAGIPEILFACNFLKVGVELTNEFWRHSASGMVANKISQSVLLTGHQIYKFNSIDILK
jgi:hypothetical protein